MTLIGFYILAVGEILYQGYMLTFHLKNSEECNFFYVCIIIFLNSQFGHLSSYRQAWHV